MKQRINIQIFIMVFLLSSVILCQLKYVGENKGAYAVSGTHVVSGFAEAYGADISFTKDGDFGVGIGYVNSRFLQSGNGFSVFFEKALSRPVEKIKVGANLFGSFSTLWIATTSTFTPTLSQGISLSGGLEFYLHTIPNIVNVEPFTQLAYSYTKASGGQSTKGLTSASIGGGIDLIINLSPYYKVCLIPVIIFGGHTKPSVGGSIMFCHTYL